MCVVGCAVRWLRKSNVLENIQFPDQHTRMKQTHTLAHKHLVYACVRLCNHQHRIKSTRVGLACRKYLFAPEAHTHTHVDMHTYSPHKRPSRPQDPPSAHLRRPRLCALTNVYTLFIFKTTFAEHPPEPVYHHRRTQAQCQAPARRTRVCCRTRVWCAMRTDI